MPGDNARPLHALRQHAAHLVLTRQVSGEEDLPLDPINV